MEAAANVSTISDAKGGKSAGKSLLPAALLLPGAEAVTFEQLLGDSAAQLGGAALLPAAEAVAGAEKAEADAKDAVDLLPVPVALPGTEAPAPANMLQVWQAWLTNAGSAAPESAGMVGQTEVAVASASPARVQPRDVGAANDKAREADAMAQQPMSAAAEQVQEPLQASRVIAPSAERDLGAHSVEVNAAGSGKELPAGFSLTQLEARKVALVQQPAQIVNIAAPLRSPEWSNTFSEQIVLLAKDGGGRAELRLNPAELGPIDVSLSVQDDRVSASFTIHHGATVDAVQAALPKLEQMMAERGVQLERVSVETNERRQEQASQQARGGQDGSSNGGGNGQGRRDGEREPGQGGARVIRRNGLVDTFA